MTVVNGYCELAELMSWNSANLAKDEATLERAIGSCSRGIDRYCRRHFWQSASLPRLFAPDNPDEFDFGAFNDLHQLDALATDTAGDGTFETTWAAADYELMPFNQLAAPEQRPYESIRQTGTQPFPYLVQGGTGRAARVRITGLWGWAALPQPIVQATLMQSARIFKRKDSPEGVAGWGAFGDIRVGRTDPDVIGMLEDYRLGRRVGMVRIR